MEYSFQKNLEHFFVAIQEVTRDLKMFGVGVANLFDAFIGERINLRVGIGEQYGRVGGDDELGALGDELMDQGEEAHLPSGRERGLGFIEDIETVSAETFIEQGEKRFAVRLFMQAIAAVGIDDGWRWIIESLVGIQFLDFRSEIVKALRTQEIAVGGFLDAALGGERLVKGGVRGPRVEAEIAAATLGIESHFNGDAFDEGGFADAVFADEKSNGGMKFEPPEMANRGNAKGILLEALHLFAPQTNRRQITSVQRFGHRVIRGYGSRRRFSMATSERRFQVFIARPVQTFYLGLSPRWLCSYCSNHPFGEVQNRRRMQAWPPAHLPEKNHFSPRF